MLVRGPLADRAARRRLTASPSGRSPAEAGLVAGRSWLRCIHCSRHLSGRLVTAMHATAAGLFLLAGLAAHVLVADLLGETSDSRFGMALMCRRRRIRDPKIRPACGADQCHPRGLACSVWPCRRARAITSCGRHRGSGVFDPYRLWYAMATRIGDEGAISAGRRLRGQRVTCTATIVVRAAATARLVSDPMVVGQSLRPIPIRDVVIDVSNFEMTGRFRNLRGGETHPQFRRHDRDAEQHRRTAADLSWPRCWRRHPAAPAPIAAFAINLTACWRVDTPEYY